MKDTNKDGTVSAAEALIYDIKHAAVDKKSDAGANQQTKNSTAQQKVGSVVDVTVWFETKVISAIWGFF